MLLVPCNVKFANTLWQSVTDTLHFHGVTWCHSECVHSLTALCLWETQIYKHILLSYVGEAAWRLIQGCYYTVWACNAKNLLPHLPWSVCVSQLGFLLGESVFVFQLSSMSMCMCVWAVKVVAETALNPNRWRRDCVGGLNLHHAEDLVAAVDCVGCGVTWLFIWLKQSSGQKKRTRQCLCQIAGYRNCKLKLSFTKHYLKTYILKKKVLRMWHWCDFVYVLFGYLYSVDI